MSTWKASLLFAGACAVILGVLFIAVRVPTPVDNTLASQTLAEVQKTGYTLRVNEERGKRFRSYLSNWTTVPGSHTSVVYYDVEAIQPNDTLPAFTMNIIQIVFDQKEQAKDFVRNFNNGTPELRNGNIAYVSKNIAYVCTKQLHFNDILKRSYRNSGSDKPEE